MPVEAGRAALEAIVGPASAYELITPPVQPAERSDQHADIEPAPLSPAGTLGAEPPDILLRLPSGAHLGILPPPSRIADMSLTHGLRVASDGRWARLPERLPARVIVAA